MKKLFVIVSVTLVALISFVSLSSKTQNLFENRSLDFDDIGFPPLVRVDFDDMGFPPLVRVDFDDIGFPPLVRV